MSDSNSPLALWHVEVESVKTGTRYNNNIDHLISLADKYISKQQYSAKPAERGY